MNQSPAIGSTSAVALPGIFEPVLSVRTTNSFWPGWIALLASSRNAENAPLC